MDKGSFLHIWDFFSGLPEVFLNDYWQDCRCKLKFTAITLPHGVENTLEEISPSVGVRVISLELLQGEG